MNIYELTNAWSKLQSMIENGDFTEEELQDTFESLDFDIEEKAENYGLVMTNLEMLANGLESEAKRLNERSKAIKSNIASMKKNLLNCMVETNKTKFKTNHFAFSTRKSKAVNMTCTLDMLPKDYVTVKTTVTPNKAAIKKALTDGKEVYGAELQENINLTIK